MNVLQLRLAYLVVVCAIVVCAIVGLMAIYNGEEGKLEEGKLPVRFKVVRKVGVKVDDGYRSPPSSEAVIILDVKTGIEYVYFHGNRDNDGPAASRLWKK